MGTILGEIAPKYGYSVAESANLGAMFIIGGIIGCVPIGIYVGKTQKYKSSTFIICLIAMMVLILEYIFFPMYIISLSYVICFI